MDTRRWGQRALMLDVAIVVATFIATAMFVANGNIAVTKHSTSDAPWYAYVLVGAAAAPLLVRRTRAVHAFVASTIAMAVLVLAVAPLGIALAPGMALYSIAARPRPASGRRDAIVIVGAGFVAYVLSCAVSIGAAPWSELAHTALWWSACWLAGERTRLQHEQVAELRRLAQSERELATVEERMRIARDLHDAAGHAINVIAVHAGAARLRHGDDPQRSLAALSTIEELARQTAAEIDGMVGGLRAHGDGRDSTPVSMAALPSLVRLHHDAGQPVEVRVSGAPRRLPAAVDQAAYRIVQEGLTNASRHGCGAADLEVDYRADAVALTISNPLGDRRSEPSPRPHDGGRGHGLIGARERAHQLGGRVDTATRDGRFVLTAVLPTTAGDAA